uniref:Major facilitator superfamily domain-containing protein 6 n=1 Tax=Sipha flava TaxID=143950 RepID=A0A2S2R414_9HEMI
MEDLVMENKDETQQKWLKTLQGLAQGIQCFGGEIPFFFWSGWIIKKIGHVNCMALSLGTTAIRMYLYTVISNPTWIILIELLNGVSYALGLAVKMSYSKIMSPPDTLNSVIGALGFFDLIGDSLGSLLGGYLFGSYGGLWSFRFFAYGSALMCCINILTNWLGLTQDLKTTNVDTALENVDDNNKTNVTNKPL